MLSVGRQSGGRIDTLNLRSRLGLAGHPGPRHAGMTLVTQRTQIREVVEGTTVG
jgi:hypothetical protein